MRGVKAKQLRREAFFILDDVPTTYKSRTMKKERVSTGRLNADGSVILMEYQGENVPEFYLLDKIQIKMVECTRSVYKKLKNLYKKGA